MSGELDHVTVLAMRLCAVRNDTSVSGEKFVELVREFARTVVAEFKATSIEAFRELQELERTADLERAGAGGTSSDDESAEKIDRVSNDEPPQTETAATPPASNHRGPHARFTSADKTALRAEYAEACAGNGGKPPYGWYSKKRAELGVGLSTLRRALGLDDREAKTPPATAQRIVATEPKSAEQTREHVNTNACWCRKGLNNASNRWCTNKPVTRHVPTLAGQQEGPARHRVSN